MSGPKTELRAASFVVLAMILWILHHGIAYEDFPTLVTPNKLHPRLGCRNGTNDTSNKNERTLDPGEPAATPDCPATEQLSERCPGGRGCAEGYGVVDAVNLGGPR